jgi:hypothetical protein
MTISIFSLFPMAISSRIRIADFAFHKPVHEKRDATLGNIQYISSAKKDYYTFSSSFRSVIRQPIFSVDKHVNKKFYTFSLCLLVAGGLLLNPMYPNVQHLYKINLSSVMDPAIRTGAHLRPAQLSNHYPVYATNSTPFL